MYWVWEGQVGHEKAGSKRALVRRNHCHSLCSGRPKGKALLADGSLAIPNGFLMEYKIIRNASNFHNKISNFWILVLCTWLQRQIRFRWAILEMRRSRENGDNPKDWSSISNRLMCSSVFWDTILRIQIKEDTKELKITHWNVLT
jgi:hypothetical protein